MGTFAGVTSSVPMRSCTQLSQACCTPVHGYLQVWVVFKTGADLIALFTLSLRISEDFWVFLSLISDRNVLHHPTNVLILRSLGKSRENQKSSLLRKEEVNKVISVPCRGDFLLNKF